MSDNFWDTELTDENGTKASGDDTKVVSEPISSVPKIEVTLADFPVNNWNSDNDAQHIVDWYNDNRMAVKAKNLENFKSLSEVNQINSRNDAQKLLDTVIITLEEEGCTVWFKPQQSIEIHSQNAGGLVAGWFFALLWSSASFFALVFIGGPVIADFGTSDWIATDGVITNSGVDTSTGGEGGTTYCLWVDYQYTYQNRTYEGDVVSFSKDNSCESWSQNADEDYPPGKQITVYVNPDNPSEAVLETGISGVDFAVCCILPFPLIGIVLIIAMTKSTYGAIMGKKSSPN